MTKSHSSTVQESGQFYGDCTNYQDDSRIHIFECKIFCKFQKSFRLSPINGKNSGIYGKSSGWTLTPNVGSRFHPLMVVATGALKIGSTYQQIL